GGQDMESSVCPGRDNVLLGKHLDGVGKGMEQPHRPEPQDAGAVGPNSVLDEGRLLALYPGMQPCQIHDPEEHDARQDELDDQVFHHVAAVPPSGFGRSNAAPWDPIFSYVKPAKGTTALANPSKISWGLRQTSG